MRPHKTKKEKAERRQCYRILRNAGVPVRQAVIFRDWTDNKVMMIALGDADPIR